MSATRPPCIVIWDDKIVNLTFVELCHIMPADKDGGFVVVVQFITGRNVHKHFRTAEEAARVQRAIGQAIEASSAQTFTVPTAEAASAGGAGGATKPARGRKS